MAHPVRKFLSLNSLAHADWKAYEAFSQNGDLAELCENSDLTFFTYDGEMYSESHDEQTCHVFREGKLIDVPWDSRPQ